MLKFLAYVDLQSKIETLTPNVDKKSSCLRVKKHGRPSQKLYKQSFFLDMLPPLITYNNPLFFLILKSGLHFIFNQPTLVESISDPSHLISILSQP